MTEITRRHVVAAIYESPPDAVATITAIQHSGFEMRNLSFAGRDWRTEGHCVAYYYAGERMKYWGKEGAFWDDLWGMLHGAALFIIPGFGHLLVAGPMFASILGALEEDCYTGDCSSVGSGILSMGVPESSVELYETALKRGKFLLLAEVYPGDTANVREIVAASSALVWDEYEAESHRNIVQV